MDIVQYLYLKGVLKMAEKNLDELFEEEVRSRIDNLNQLSIDEKRQQIMDEIESFNQLRINEKDLKRKQEETNADKLKEDDEKKTRYIKIGLEAAGIVLPLLFYGWWMKKGFQFEKEGTFTSVTFRNLFNRFRPTK